MRVLLVKTSSMGDVLHALPALTDAMQAMADIQIDWVVEENFAQIPSWHPAVKRIIPVAIRRWRKQWFSSQHRAERHVFYQQLCAQQYDVIIDAQGLLKSAALISRRAFGVKHGFNWQSAKEPLASLFYQHRHAVAKSQHAVERIRQLFALSLNYSLPAHPGDYAINQTLRAFTPMPSRDYVVFLHATTRDEKHWPESHWRELIALLHQNGLHVHLPWGAPHEQQRAYRLAEGFDHVTVLPKLSLQQVASELLGANTVVSVDTGLSHLAAALGKPNITLYGPTDPGLIGGYGENQHVILADDKNISSIHPAHVFAILNSQLQ